jgi:3-oxoacyl-[acyl-carrier-protein] synthase-3
MFKSRISGTGSYLPEKLLTNSDLEKIVETNDEWIRTRTGIERRHIASPTQVTSDLALIASQRALEASKLQATDIEFIIFASVTGDQIMPASACVLQEKLGLKGIPAFDLSAACSGFIYSLSVADQFIRTGQYKHILIVGAEITSRFVNYEDRESCILFGDGAGAFVLSRNEGQDEGCLYSTHLRAEGSLGDLFVLPAGGSKIPFSEQVLVEKTHLMKMKGKEIFKNAVRTMSSTCQEALQKNKMTSENIHWLVPHQANSRIMEAVADHFHFPKDKVISIVHEMGNTSAATIPVAFDTAVRDGRIQRGQNILLTAFGAGLTAGSALLRY